LSNCEKRRITEVQRSSWNYSLQQKIKLKKRKKKRKKMKANITEKGEKI